MSPVLKRIATLGALALALGACDYGLGLSPDPVDAGETVTVTNAPDGPYCEVPDLEVRDASPAAPGDGVPVDIVLLSNLDEFEGEPSVVATVETDADGYFTATFEAPDIPGEHLVFAFCNGIDGGLEPLSLQAAAEQVDEDGTIVDSLRVGQDPLSIDLSDDSVEEGDEVIATFNRCQDENDLGFAAVEGGGGGGGAVAADPTPEELATDYPDLEVFLDGELVDTIEGTERYPTGTVDVPVTLDEVGEHEITGVCTYQTFDLDLEELVALFNEIGGEGPLLQGVSAAAIDYPFPGDDAEGELAFFQWDEATTQAAAPVTVTAADVGGTDAEPQPAAPVPAAPTFTG